MDKLEKPELTFDVDENDPDDPGNWSMNYANYRFYLTTDHFKKIGTPIFCITRRNGDEGDTAFFYPDGTIELGPYGIKTSFNEIYKLLELRDAVRLLKNL